MKILLIGEFSGVHTNLKKGLTELGHNVAIASDGDGYRGFTSDIKISPYNGLGLVSILLNILYITLNIRKFTGYDIVQFIFPFSLPSYYHQIGIFRIIKLFNKKITYYACGSDPSFLESESKFDYFPLEDKNSEDYPIYSSKHHKIFEMFMNSIDIIIPSMYTYSFRGEYDHIKTHPIPLPGSGMIYIKELEVNSKIKILFGISRKDFKGAKFILQALEKTKHNYEDKVDVKIVENIPFHEYNKLLENTDILIDQCKSYDYAMNAIFALEKGTVVLSGNESIALEYLGINNCPVVNIKPDSEYIYSKIKDIIIEQKSLLIRKHNSLKYVEKEHNPITIARSFYNVYNVLLNT